MVEVNSDSELSTDSLEDLRKNLSGIHPYQKDNQCLESIESGNHDENLQDKEAIRKKTEVYYKKISKTAEDSNTNKDDKRQVCSKGSDIYNGSSYFFSDVPRSQSARIPSRPIRRVSRRQSICFEAPESHRIRHKSVSYLEQFKKKHSETNNTDGLTAFTMLPSEKTLTCASGTTIASINKTDTSSEFEFYKEILINADSDVENIKREENRPNYKVEPLDLKEPSKQRKGQSSIQEGRKPNRDFTSSVQPYYDKRKALEKRDEYSKKVQLMNQIKSIRQKEKDKTIKFKNSHFKSHPCEQEYCHQSREQKLILDSNDFSTVPFLINQLDLSAPTRSNLHTEKTLSKPVKTETKSKTKKSSSEVCKLSILQKRHETEKTVVDSIRNCFTKR